MYLTHDLDFAATRIDSKKIWIKSHDGHEKWEYQILEGSGLLPEQVFYEILGSRNEIVFVEGDVSSLDYSIFQLLYRNFTIKPVGSCTKVIQYVKSFNEQGSFHRISAKGIIDYDRRPEEEIAALKEKNIFTLQVAEIENIFLHEECILALSRKMNKDPQFVLNEIQDNLFNFFETQIEFQVTQVTAFLLKRELSNSVDEKSKNLESLLSSISNFYDEDNITEIYNDIRKEFEGIIQNRDYLSLLKSFNNKGVLANSNFHNLCGLNNPHEVIEQIKVIIKNGENQTLNSALRSLTQIL